MNWNLDQVALATLFVFVVGLIYDAGRKAEQLAALNDWRKSLDTKIDTAISALARVEALTEHKGHDR